MTQRPPLDVEPALDLVLALAAHRSHNERHADFGRTLIDEYFVKLRERYKDDEQALGYLTNLLAAVAATVRAFSVQRDIFESERRALTQEYEHCKERAARLARYSPLAEESHWGKVLGSSSGAAVMGVVGEGIRVYAAGSPLLVLLGMVVGAVLGFFALDFLIDHWRYSCLTKAEASLPDQVDAMWRTTSVSEHRVFLRKFLLSAIITREQWYPELPSLAAEDVCSVYRVPHIQSKAAPGRPTGLKPIAELEPELDAIIDRHLSFSETSRH